MRRGRDKGEAKRARKKDQRTRSLGSYLVGGQEQVWKHVQRHANVWAHVDVRADTWERSLAVAVAVAVVVLTK